MLQTLKKLLLFAGTASASTILNRGTFASPKTGVKWRYWIEDANVDLDILNSDIAEIAQVGSSGFELLSYQSYGSVLSSTGLILVDPTDFAFGSDRFVNITASVVQAAINNNLTIDFTLGPDQGAGVPVLPDDVDMEGMNTELVFGSHFIAAGEIYDGPIPQPEIFPFLRFDGTIASANISQMQFVGVIGAHVADGANISSNRVSLDFNTVQDLSSQVKSSGNSTTVSWTPSLKGTNVVLSYFSRRNGYPEARPGFNGPEPGQPGSWGSWVVDHFSAKGVNISTTFIQNNILSNANIGEMLALPGVGQYMWEDSMEYQAQLFWTDAFSERFVERHGYEINLTLPVLHTLPSSKSLQTQPNQTFDYGTTFNWEKFTEDYQDTLTSLYIDYMGNFSEWAHSIGMSFSNQPAYNFRLDAAASAAIPDTPEIESLGVPTIDQARQLSGGVHLGNRTIFSSETGARPGEANAIRMVELLQDAKTQYAGGVNVALLHGFPYSGNYPNTTWPGITTFGYNFADMHGPRMPAWDHYKEYLDYLARIQYTLQAGVAKVDLGIYRKGYNIISPPPYEGTSLLTNSGFTYEYVSPENFKLPGVTVSNSRLAPSGPAYKAFLLGRQENITVDAAQSLVHYAQNGLPIVIVGDVPSDIPGFENGNASMVQVQSLMSQLTAEPTVVVIANESDVSSALVSLAVLPAVAADPPSTTLYSIVRQVDDDDTGTKTAYFFLFNQGASTINFTLTLNPGFIGSPFVLDPWTGDVAPLVLYSNSTSGNISIPDISLTPSQTALFAVTSGDSLEGVPVQNIRLISSDPGIIAVVSNASISGPQVELRSFNEGSKQLVTLAGDTITAKFSLEGETSRVLSEWQLNVTAWTPPQNLSDSKSVLVPQPAVNLTQGLIPWNQIEGLTNVSGVGTYFTSFEWTHAEDGVVGLLLDFGEIFHTIKAWLNGQQITTADPTHPVVDISKLVINGTNSIRVDAASTLLNAVNAVSLLTIEHDSRPAYACLGSAS
ncbi:hypothetical protein J3R30DRAFT_3295777 [Lentinula aciculospora]|uniref:Glycoside hydrolase family 2 protein n=1 Tax=Lentinula aciculospora TaxID=153920 RepID=A0A9W9A4W7_9AGAR|nr:hypothetical protein J3R30DRAFT_3295777 [Lentinula aciculospora]